MVVPNFMVPAEAFLIEENGKTAITNYICRLLMAYKTVLLNSDLSLLRDIRPSENMFNLIMSETHNTFDYTDVPLDSKFTIQEEQNSYQQKMISIRLNISYEYIDLKLRLSISDTKYGMVYKCYTLYRNYNIQVDSALSDHPIWLLNNVGEWLYKIHFIYPFYNQFHMHVQEERMVRELIKEIPIIKEMRSEILSFIPDRKWNIMMLLGKYFNIFIMEGDLSVINRDECYATNFIHLMMEDLSDPKITISRFVKPFNSGFFVYDNIVESIEEIVEDKILQLEKVSSTDPNLILETMKSWMISHSFKGKYMEEEESREGILQELINQS